MNFPAIPRHQNEITAKDYARMLANLAGAGDRVKETERFESQFADYVGCRQAIAVSSGRLGMHLVLKHCGLGPAAEAIIPAFNYYIVVEQFLGLGIKPVFADVCRENLNIDSSKLDPLVTPRTHVLLATHMFGEPCDLGAITELVQRHNLIMIEDCAHGLGTRWKGQHVGTFGRAGVFSLSSMKLATAFGGGMVVTDDDQLATAIRDDLARLHVDVGLINAARRFLKGALLDIGTRTLPFGVGIWPALRLARAIKPDIQQRVMTETPQRVNGSTITHAKPLHAFQVRLGRSQLDRVESFIEGRRRVMASLDEALDDIDGVTLMRHNQSARNNGMYYGVLTDRPEELSKYLFVRGIDSETSEYCNCADEYIYREFHRDCPVSRDVQRRILRLPSHPRLKKRDIQRIAQAIRQFYQQAERAVPCVSMS